jgi:hypothetical protein
METAGRGSKAFLCDFGAVSREVALRVSCEVEKEARFAVSARVYGGVIFMAWVGHCISQAKH